MAVMAIGNTGPL